MVLCGNISYEYTLFFGPKVCDINSCSQVRSIIHEPVMQGIIPFQRVGRNWVFRLDLQIPHVRVAHILNQVKKGDSIRSEQVTQRLQQEELVEIPYDREGAKTAINRGEPLLTDRKTHPLTKPLLELVRAVRELLIVVAE